MKVALAQINPTVGDVSGNLNLVRDALSKASKQNADLVVLPELFLCGYPPCDLLCYSRFLEQLDYAAAEVCRLSRRFPQVGMVLGTVRRNDRPTGKGLHNSALFICNGNIVFEQHKQLLPTYDVFDERRYFDPGLTSGVVGFKGEIIGISICEDAWNDPDFEKHREYESNPIEPLVTKGATLLINISASPFHLERETHRYARYSNHARKWRVPFVFVNLVGANDELIFDGNSMALDSNGKLITILEPYREQVQVIETSRPGHSDELPPRPAMEALHGALVLGIRDYMRKCGFQNAVIGLSGGIDSALTACLAVDAIGQENVRGVTMPSEFSSAGAMDDSLHLARNLGIRCDVHPIHDIYQAYLRALEEPFKDLPFGVTEENIQARIRGNLLMAYANKFGGIVLTTGNKSELAVGYCTLYGDMSGGLAVISDLPKTTVYDLAHWYNRQREIIPAAILAKAPSAELRPNQKDQDSLPPYETLDPILDLYLEEQQSESQIVAAGFEPEVVHWVLKAVNRNEYKRKQAAPGLRVTSKAFGIGRRMPIAAKWE